MHRSFCERCRYLASHWGEGSELQKAPSSKQITSDWRNPFAEWERKWAEIQETETEKGTLSSTQHGDFVNHNVLLNQSEAILNHNVLEDSSVFEDVLKTHIYFVLEITMVILNRMYV
jgi:hypothetical protein